MAPKNAARSTKKRKTPIKKRSVSKAKSAKLRKLFTLIGLFLVSGIFLFVVMGYKTLTKNFAGAYDGYAYDIRDEDFYTIVYIQVEDFFDNPQIPQKLKYFIFDKANKKAYHMDFPDDLMVDMPGKFGTEEILKSFALGSLNSPDSPQGGVDLTTRMLSSMLAFPVDRYLIVDSTLSPDFAKFLENGSLLITFDIARVKGLSDNMSTNMSVEEFFDLYTFVNSVETGNFIELTFNSSYVDEPELLDEQLRNITFDNDIAAERKNIAILNGGGKSGLAGFGSRAAKNLGGRVVSVENASKSYNESFIITDDLNSATTRELSRSLRITNILTKDDAGFATENELYRSDVVVILGIDKNDDL